jgi:DeoR/GlpR family transcriptional regulator of sugar metabolism
MMRCADEVMVVADHTKFGRPALAFLCELKEIDTLIVDRPLTRVQREIVGDADVRVVVAGESEEFGA